MGHRRQAEWVGVLTTLARHSAAIAIGILRVLAANIVTAKNHSK
jgi:hypothetical protein